MPFVDTMTLGEDGQSLIDQKEAQPFRKRQERDRMSAHSRDKKSQNIKVGRGDKFSTGHIN